MAEPELFEDIFARMLRQAARKDNNMRRVEARVRNIKTQGFDTIQGVFHNWGVVSTETCDGGIGTDTVAIIEKDDGQVVTPYACNVRFLSATHGVL